MNNAVSWFEIPAADLSRAKAFYETILAVDLHPMEFPNGLKMAVFPTEQGGIGGALAHYPEFYEPGKQGALVYLNGNPDLGKVLERVDSSGGQVIMPKTQISPEYGYMGVFMDTEGNRVALHSQG
ncbi:MAG: VOC family protein [Chitinophagales bacterium]|nr:VOC family protein [Chitinophagaceae bacterium]MCB9065604.1 VOC family protein [Chitinophagales bacterium]